MFSLGQIVYSKCGRDRGKAFVIVAFNDGYAFLADGDIRKLSSPKKKKAKHIQITNEILFDIQQKLLQGDYLLDADIRKALVNATK